MSTIIMKELNKITKELKMTLDEATELLDSMLKEYQRNLDEAMEEQHKRMEDDRIQCDFDFTEPIWCLDGEGTALFYSLGKNEKGI